MCCLGLLSFPRNQASFNFVAAVTICSGLEPKKIKSVTAFTFFLFYLPWSDGTGCHDLGFFSVEFQASFFTCLFHPHQETLVHLHSLPLEWFHLHIWGCWYFCQQSWFQLVIHPSPAFHIMYSEYKLNKQSDSIKPWQTPFSILNQSVVLCPLLTVASWPAFRFLRRQVRWSGIPISLRIFHSLL